jgi:hypothetical protein
MGARPATVEEEMKRIFILAFCMVGLLGAVCKNCHKVTENQKCPEIIICEKFCKKFERGGVSHTLRRWDICVCMDGTQVDL